MSTKLPSSSGLTRVRKHTPHKTPCEYVWLDAAGEVRSKIRTLNSPPGDLKEVPLWNFDGSSTDQSTTERSDVELIPIDRIYPHPFFDGIIVFCRTRTYGQDKISFEKTVRLAEETFDNEPWFAFEQEYTLINPQTGLPMGWKGTTPPPPQGPYYCGNGCEVAYGRDLVEAHYFACLSIGLNVSGLNAEVMPGQWEYQLGPCTAIESCVQLMLSRFILHRLAEKLEYVVTLHPKPIPNWNGAGMHTNFSTKDMRESYQPILHYAETLGKRHKEHMVVYGKDNDQRLVGAYETSNYHTFKYGVGDRSASVRIPIHVYEDQKGYLEDRRPASNANPFDIVAVMLETLEESLKMSEDCENSDGEIEV